MKKPCVVVVVVVYVVVVVVVYPVVYIVVVVVEVVAYVLDNVVGQPRGRSLRQPPPRPLVLVRLVLVAISKNIFARREAVRDLGDDDCVWVFPNTRHASEMIHAPPCSMLWKQHQ